MAGYSGTPLWKKLGVKPGGRLLLLGSPSGWSAGELPEGAVEKRARPAPTASAPGKAGAAQDVTIVFVRALEELAGAIEPLAQRIFPEGALWVAWPRRAAGHESDIREQDIRDLALPLGIVDVKVAAIDEDWSGLRLVWRRELRDPPSSD
ncbi:MAG TPA: DUF3052 domain-containing protein [Solirubrobacteraceae bacterium]|nr:DUF3052 domain-containing protein [Solirubrobacteraceae bacterium]